MANPPVIPLTTANPNYPPSTGPATGPVVAVKWDPSFQGQPSLTFGLVVTDSLGVSSVQATVTVRIQPQPVAVLAGPPNNIVSAGSNISLDGSKSTGVGLTYHWQLLAPPR